MYFTLSHKDEQKFKDLMRFFIFVTYDPCPGFGVSYMCCIHGSNSKYGRSHVLRPQCRRVEISVFGASYARTCFSCLFGFLTQARAPGHASGPALTGGPQRKRRPAGASGPPWLGAGLSAWAEARLLWWAPRGVGLRQFPTAGSGTPHFW